MPLIFVLIAILFCTVSGLPGLFLSRRSPWGQRCAALLMCVGALSGLAGACMGLSADGTRTMRLPWPVMGDSLIGLDALSAFFLFPVFLMGGLGSVYGLTYWPQVRRVSSAAKVQFFWGLLTAGMALLLISKHAFAFLLGWEAMAIAAFFLIAAEDRQAPCRRAAWIYFIATHICTLTLFALFALWRWATGTFSFVPVPEHVTLGVLNVMFLLLLIGFGTKAGIMPMHFWLPGAHANAPSHVSAMLSGVVLKMGIYGIVRFLSLLPDPPYIWGGLILLLGAVSGLLGVVFAISQHDLKRLLAYHSVENIGIILMGLGLAMMGRSAGRPEWIILGMAGCLLHTWNHSLFKSLLFFSAGSVLHAARTRQIDRLGGLARQMPWTAAMFFIGAVSICGLPPLNGFISELFVYKGLFAVTLTNGGQAAASAIAVAVLAMIGALALACFVKVYGAVFLGIPRSLTVSPHESPAMYLPMTVLAVCCTAIGLAPVLLAPVLNRAIAAWLPGVDLASTGVTTVLPLRTLSWSAVILALAVALPALVLTMNLRRSSVGTWDCGYARPVRRIQYTASSFAQMIVAMFRWVLAPRVRHSCIKGLFPAASALETHVDDAVLDRMILPLSCKIERLFRWFHRLQQGITQQYLLYILLTVVVMLSTTIPFKEFFATLFAR